MKNENQDLLLEAPIGRLIWNMSVHAVLVTVCGLLFLDPVFIFGFHMGAAGAAAATVFAQCVSAAMSIYYFFLSGKRRTRILPRHFIPDRRIIGEILLIGIPSFVQMTGYSLSIIQPTFRRSGKREPRCFWHCVIR